MLAASTVMVIEWHEVDGGGSLHHTTSTPTPPQSAIPDGWPHFLSNNVDSKKIRLPSCAIPFHKDDIDPVELSWLFEALTGDSKFE